MYAALYFSLSVFPGNFLKLTLANSFALVIAAVTFASLPNIFNNCESKAALYLSALSSLFCESAVNPLAAPPNASPNVWTRVGSALAPKAVKKSPILCVAVG